MADGAIKDQKLPEATPQWLGEMRSNGPGGNHISKPRGFYVNFEKFAAVYVARGNNRLVVAFDNLSAVNDTSLNREAWGDKFYAENGWSSLGIISFDANWYRDDVLFDYLENLRDTGFFAQFKNVVFTGTSMGGYAAAAFCDLAPGSTVIAFSPQSTLSKALVPWEKRFNRGRKQDWSGRYTDAANHTSAAARVYLCYDPYMPGDKSHASRFTGDNIVHLHSNYVGHKNVVFLRKVGILKDVTRQCINHKMTTAKFNALFRARRSLPWYYFGLFDMALARNHRALTDIIIRNVAQASGNPNLPKTLRNRRKQYWENEKSGKGG